MSQPRGAAASAFSQNSVVGESWDIPASTWKRHCNLFRRTFTASLASLGDRRCLASSAYIVFLCLELLSLRPGSKARVAEVLHPVGLVRAAKENSELVAAETPIPAEAESPSGEAVRVHALPDDAPMSIISVTLALEGEPALEVVSAAGCCPRGR